jgi:hypothetical protein
MKAKKLILAVSLGVLLLPLTGCTSRFDRSVKNVESNWFGGLNRTVEVYDFQGHKIRTYEGKLDLQETNGNKVLFDLDGKRHVIYNAIVIVDEK